MEASTLSRRLRDILGNDGVSTTAASLDRYSIDALDRIRAFGAARYLEAQPQAVVSPESAEQVAGVVREANEAGVPIIPYGAGTGVMGAVVPLRGGIVLDLSRMNRVREINTEDLTARVEPGVVLEDLDRQLRRHGLRVGHDPWSQPMATVGGAISTNGVGYLAGRYGPMGDQVVGLEVVLPTGETVSTRPVPKAAGPSLKHLFIGAEGTLGVITEATIRVFPQPEERRLSTFTFDTFETGFQAVQLLRRMGIHPAILDLSEESARRGGRDSDETEVTLITGSEGYGELVAAEQRMIAEACGSAGGRNEGPDEAERYWRYRHEIAKRYQKDMLGKPGSVRRDRGWLRMMDYLHVSLPPSQVLPLYQWSKEAIPERGLYWYEAALWGRPCLFSLLIGAPEQSVGGAGRLASAVDDVLTRAQELGGSMEYCHGVGVKLMHLMDGEWGTVGTAIRSIKSALDPRGIMNPGKLGL